ncbi:MAG: hypothetical protein M1833_006522 [Piccolia ochrophora]|nr:MAG: hypothetical protein M1833_006522 [Piccolia ochrophora]
MPAEDLLQHATSDHDFYALLDVTSASSPTDIRRAYRKTALKYHPDKNAHDPSAVEKFHLLQIAYDVLSDEAVKTAYDAARAARLAKQRQRQLFEGKRRQMMDDLERRERGVKRDRDEEVDAEETLRREVARLAEDGKRRRREREEMLRKEALEEEQEQQDPTAASTPQKTTAPPTPTPVPEISRTLKVRWPRTSSSTPTASSLSALFSRFGPITSTFLLKDKPQRLGGSKHKTITATCVLVFASVVGAHKAVEDFPALKRGGGGGDEWKLLDSVSWAGGQEPDFSNGDATSAPATPLHHGQTDTPKQRRQRQQQVPFPFTTPRSAPSNGATSSHSTPSFSFSTPVKSATPSSKPQTPSAASALGAGSPSFEELTLIRLKKAEKKRMEEEIRRRERDEEGGEVEVEVKGRG